MNAPAVGRGGLDGGFQPTISPLWSERIPDRIACCAWFLKQNPQIYLEFRRLADNFRMRNPDRPFSAELIVNVLRFETSTRAKNDQFGIGSNYKSLLARLYKRERLDANIDLRRCWLDSLRPSEWDLITVGWIR